MNRSHTPSVLQADLTGTPLLAPSAKGISWGITNGGLFTHVLAFRWFLA